MNNQQAIPDALLDDRLGFLGTSGSGKTYAAGGAVERLLKSRARVLVIDPLGVWYGLRLLPDGKTPSPHNVVIFGGRHGDLPLNEHAGALIGETAATMAESCIIDLSQLGTKSAERRFMVGFLDAIYRKATGEPFHLVIDEADLFAPQRPPKGDETLLNLTEQIVRRGRVKGFVPWMISQRPAVLNKNVLSQVDGLIALKLTSSQDRDALDAWIEGQADKVHGKAIKDALPAMQIGQGIVWAPTHRILDQVTFPTKKTYDSSRTPKRGEKARPTATLNALDLGVLRERLATVETETKANDPRVLKMRIADLEKQLAAKAPTIDQAAVDQAWTDGFHQGKSEQAAEDSEKLRQLQTAVDGALGHLIAHAHRETDGSAIVDVAPRWTPETIEQRRPVLARRQMTKPEPAPRPTAATSSNGALPAGELGCLTAAAQSRDGVTRSQLTILLGYKRSTRDAYVQRLRGKGYVDISGDRIVATSEGIAALGPNYQPLPTGDELRRHWLFTLPEGERVVLELAIAMYPDGLRLSTIDAQTNYARSTRDAYIQRLKARELIAIRGNEIVVSDLLFD